jgi:PAS domain S-box-containing protein
MFPEARRKPVSEPDVADETTPEQRLLRAAFADVHDLVAVCDADGRIILVNRALEVFAGVGPAAALPRSWSADGILVPSEASPLRRALRGEQVHDVEMVLEANSGRRQRMIADAQQLCEPGGTVIGAIVTWHDVTEWDRARRTRESGGDQLLAQETRDEVRERDADEEALRQALAREEFFVAYQPKVSLSTDRTVGAEALLRWNHPERGVVSPLDFIPLAETSGLIVPIGSWVLAQVCHDAQRWKASLPGGRPLMIAVNVSPRQFESGLVESFGGIIGDAGVDPSMVCLEVTESMVMRDAEVAITTLRDLKALGLHISVDDFGTGFSSLAYLKRFPLDELKIDKSFVDGLGRDLEATAIVAAVMGMAHALGLCVVAEGVETADQAERLRTLGCDEAQGFFYARPGSADDIDERLVAEAAVTIGGHRAPGVRAGVAARSNRVLVVDDAADVRQLARSSLAAVGMEVRDAASGEDAIRMAGRFKPDCIILDVHLPGISGFDVCRMLRADPRHEHTTIVVLTGDAEPAEKVMAFSLEADDYIVKPFSPRDLVSRVNAAMLRRVEMLARTYA